MVDIFTSSFVDKFMKEMKSLNTLIENMLSCEFFYLNGKKIDITLHDKKPKEAILLIVIRENLKDTIPEDSVFLKENGQIMTKDEEYFTSTVLHFKTNIFYIWSDTLYSQRKYEPKNIIIDFKILEENEEFNVYEYPTQEIKEDEEFYALILFGDNGENIKFINGFLNFLYDVEKEDKFRYKIIDKEENKGFLKIVDIKHEKGNFKFYCFNFSADKVLTNEDLITLEKILNNNNEDIHIDFIVYNKIDKKYSSRFENKEFIHDVQEIISQLIKNKLKTNKINYFFAGPNILFDKFIYYLRSLKVQLYGINIPDNAYDRSRTELKDFFSLYYCFGNYDSIYEKASSKINICDYNRLMDGFSNFYVALKEAPKNYQFKAERKFFLFLKEIYEPVLTTYNEIKNLDPVRTEQDKENFKTNKEELKKVQASLESNIKNNDDLKRYINQKKDKIFANQNEFLIPYKYEGNSLIDNYYKSMSCPNCYCTCHANCKDLIKHFCKAFDFKFNCKVCPNKCPASEHNCNRGDYAPREYKTFNQLFPKEITEINNVNSKCQAAGEYLEKQKEDFKGKIEELKKKMGLIEFELQGIPMHDISSLNHKLASELLKFSDKFKSNTDFKESFEAEYFKLIMFNFMKLYHLFSKESHLIWPDKHNLNV